MAPSLNNTIFCVPIQYMFIEVKVIHHKVIKICNMKQKQTADIGLLGCNTMWTCRKIPTFWRNTLSPSSGQYVSQKCWYLPTSPHSVTTQKTNNNIFITVRTSYLVTNKHGKFWNIQRQTNKIYVLSNP
jgi:hypothetical protein